jgi:zinc transporter
MKRPEDARLDPRQLFEGIPGLVWAYRFAADGRAARLEAPVEPALIDEVHQSGDWLWLHFSQTDSRVAAFLQRLDLPPRAVQTLLSHDEHVSLHLERDTAWGVVADWQHSIDDEFVARPAELDDGERDIGRLHFALTDQLVISTRRTALQSVDRVRCNLDEGLQLTSAPQVLETIVEGFASSVARTTRELADALDGIEDRVLAEKSGDERRDLGDLRRRAVRMHRPLNALRRVTLQFEQRHQGKSHAMLAIAARLLQRFDELDNDIVMIQDRARLLHDEVSAKLTDQTNRQLYVLSILSALFLPPTLVVGVFGMNTKGLPLTDSPDGFLLAMVLCAMSSAMVYGILRRLGVR